MGGHSSAWMMPPLQGTTSNGGPLRWIMKAIPKQAWSIPTFIPNSKLFRPEGRARAEARGRRGVRRRVVAAEPAQARVAGRASPGAVPAVQKPDWPAVRLPVGIQT